MFRLNHLDDEVVVVMVMLVVVIDKEQPGQLSKHRPSRGQFFRKSPISNKKNQLRPNNINLFL